MAGRHEKEVDSNAETQGIYRALVGMHRWAILAGMLVGLWPNGRHGRAGTPPRPTRSTSVLKAGKLRVGLDIFVPWVPRTRTATWSGFEVDVATKLAQDMGVEVEFVPTEWSGIIPALLTGKFDVIIGGMSVTAERALKVNFTDPVLVERHRRGGEQDHASRCDRIDALNKADVIIAVRLGATPPRPRAKLPRCRTAPVRHR